MSADFLSVDDSIPTFLPPVANAATPASLHVATSSSQLWQAGHYQQLAARLTQELRHAEACGDKSALIGAANDLACTHRASGDHETAAYFQLLAATAERQSAAGLPGRISATSVGNLACDALLAGRLAIAEGLLWKSLLMELAAGNDSGAAADWANLGLLASSLGDFASAKERLWWALKLHHRLGDAFHVGLDLWHLAQMFESEGAWKYAHGLYRRATHWFRLAGHTEFEHLAEHSTQINAARKAVFAFDVRLN